LVKLGDLRIVEAIIARNALADNAANSLSQEACQHLFQRAKSTLQRAISLEGLEIEHIIEGKHLLATVYCLLGDLATGQHIALQTLKDAQEQEAISIIGRAYRLLGRILAAQQDYEQADYYFAQAMQVFREPALRLDYARVLHAYGLALVQHSRLSTDTASNAKIQAKDQQEKLYLRGLSSLQEARTIFATCHAVIDLNWVEQALSKVETQNIGKR
jgi:tetratricopeptide (TPR) repeat protein